MTYLLTGGSGVLGTELQKHLTCWAPDRVVLDITRYGDPIMAMWHKEALSKVKCIIHAAAYTDVPGAEINKQLAIQININGSKNIVGFSERYKWKKVYISTDYVYEGLTGGYKETDQCAPLNFYAWTKYAGESYFDHDKDLIIRTSFKSNAPWPYEFAFDDLFTSADYVDMIAPKIAKLIESGAVGVYNVGTERKSIFELAKQRTPEVSPCSVGSIASVKMPKDISLNTEKYKKIERKG